MDQENENEVPSLNRRQVLKTVGMAAAGIAAVGAAHTAYTAESQQPAGEAKPPGPAEQSAYGAPAGTGISMPPYYQPTPSVLNRNIYLPGTEPLGRDEMRITFMGSQPWPPRISQAAECIMVELGRDQRLFFDFGPGCMRNIVANQVPIAEIDNIFLSHLHADHIGELPYLWSFSPFAGRWKPIHIIGPSGRTPELGTKAMWDGMKKFAAWGVRAFQGTGPMPALDSDHVTEFDFHDDGGVCFDQEGTKVIHWRRSHAMDGASAFRVDWNGLSFVYTGDGKPDWLTAKYAKGADVFVSEMAVDVINLWAMKQGLPPVFGALTLDIHHTTHYGFGYLADLVKPRLAVATHLSFDQELLNEMSAGVRLFYKGMFTYGVDNTVINVTKDRVWVREAAVTDFAGVKSPDPMWILKNQFDGKLPTLPKPRYSIRENQEQSVRDLEIDPALFTPKDQIRKWMREWPEDANIEDFLPKPAGGMHLFRK